MTPAPGPRITVLGSINMDLVVRCSKLPAPGETISARSFAEIPGGKGANQAVAAARAGGQVRLIGCVGRDGFGDQLLRHLATEGVHCDAVSSIEDQPTGVAIVAVEDGGENSIIVVPGANACCDVNLVDRSQSIIADADLLMVQLETPLQSVVAAVNAAREAGVKVVLDPAPAVELPSELFGVDLICPNETEAAAITGRTLESIDDAASIAAELLRRGARAAAITLGARGTYFAQGDQGELIPSRPVDAVDTTAAGDAFAGTLAVRWAETGSLREAVRCANLAGGLAASRHGAQPSLPTRDEVDELLAP